MAISDKLNYLIETKQLFKDRLNSLGAEIIKSTTFRNYLNWLDNMYNKVSDKTDLAKNGIVGKTNQDSTTGKNLFDESLITSIGGTIKYIPINVKKNTDYTLSTNSGTSTLANVFLSTTNSGVTTNNNGAMIDQPRTINSGDNNIMYVSYRNDLSSYWIQLEEGSTATLYEPYTGGEPSPSPDYPQEINNLSGDVEYKARGKNLFDINNTLNNNLYNQGTSLSLITNGIRATTEAVSNYRMGLIKIGETNKLIGKTIRVKANFSSNGNNNGRFYIGYCDARGDNRVTKSDTTTSGNTLSMVVESGSGENICLVLYSNNNGTNYTIGNYVDYKNIIMTVDNEDMTYEPYISESFPLSLGDIELCHISDYKDRIYSQNGEFYLEKKTGKVVLDGSEDWATAITRTSYNKVVRQFSLNNAILNQGSSSNITKSTHFGSESADNIFSNSATGINCMGISSSGYLRVGLDLTVFPNDSSFKTWLSTHNTEVQYVLATSTTTEITQENYPTLYSQLLAIQEFLTKYKINKEFLLDYSSPEIKY